MAVVLAGRDRDRVLGGPDDLVVGILGTEADVQRLLVGRAAAHVEAARRELGVALEGRAADVAARVAVLVVEPVGEAARLEFGEDPREVGEVGGVPGKAVLEGHVGDDAAEAVGRDGVHQRGTVAVGPVVDDGVGAVAPGRIREECL